MKRSRKLRGHRTHGHGKKATRGAGLRGGRGRAGSHKHEYMKALKSGRRFGNYGFKSIKTAKSEAINIGELNQLMSDKVKVVDLSSRGIEKLLGAGSLSAKAKGKEIKVREASAKAVEKVEEAGARLVTGDG